MNDPTHIQDSNGIQTQPDEKDLEALSVVAEIMRAGAFELAPEIRAIDGSYLVIDLVGDDAGRIFGANGRMLDAMQYLVNLVVSHQIGPGVRILLDADGYRARRAAQLEQIALKYAALVKERQEECEFDPLPPHERRSIHQLFADDPDVMSYSEGAGPDRKVILAPRNSQA